MPHRFKVIPPRHNWKHAVTREVGREMYSLKV